MSRAPDLVSPSSDWERYKNIAKRDTVFANFAYTKETFLSEDTSSMGEELKNMAEKIPEGFQLFFCSDSLDETRKHKFRAAVFVNHISKEVLIATSGTRFGIDATGIQDLYDDAFLAFEKEPPKMESVRELNAMLVDSLGAELSSYKFHYTGHSLGAAVSDMAAADLAIKCRKKGLEKGRGMPEISTMTFENPGAKVIIENMYKKAGFAKEEYKNDVDYKGINNGRNFINRGSKHAGEMWEIVEDNKEQDMFKVFMQYISRKLEPFLKILPKIINTIAFGDISSQVDSHKLDKIDDVLCERVDGVSIVKSEEIDKKIDDRAHSAIYMYLSEIVTACVKVAFNSDIWKNLTEKKERSGNVGKVSNVMVSPSGDIIVMSRLELDSSARTISLSSSEIADSDSRRITPSVSDILREGRKISR
jgi:hypothetical protein